MTTSHPSDSRSETPAENPQASRAFERLHERVRRWIWEKGWTELRGIQEQAIAPILEGASDVILAAGTAAGKTEAAFLPICSRLVGCPEDGIRALYVSPLKALINDQFGRAEELCRDLDIPVHRWHGDVASTRKRKLLENPAGILLITPESLEAIFVSQGHRVASVFAPLDRIVLDELHAYLGTERGRHLQSLLHRVDIAVRRRAQRIGLSATLGDMSIAAGYLRPREADQVIVLQSEHQEQELRLQVRGYWIPAVVDESTSDQDGSTRAVGADLFRILRGGKHLVFANARAAVELYSDILRQQSEEAHLPNEFIPHHGSLSRELREDAEAKLKDTSRPSTAVCTSTLELGIDIGQVQSIAQIGAPFSVASLRQRLGRSGRRGDPAVMRFFIREPEISPRSELLDTLRVELVQTIAMVELLLERWCEPSDAASLHLSTLVHQTLALIAERGGVTAQRAWQALCVTGPFERIDERDFVRLLRCMGSKALIEQSPDGTLILGEQGEKIVNHFSFYAVFATPEEYRIVHQGHTLGSMAFDLGVMVDTHLVFAGRRWKVVGVDSDAKEIVVEPARGGRLPHFAGSHGGLVHDEIRRRMRMVYESTQEYAYLDAGAREMLVQARTSYGRLELATTSIVRDGNDTLLILFRGDRVLNTTAVLLRANGISPDTEGPAIRAVDSEPAELARVLHSIAAVPPSDPTALARVVMNKVSEKYDWVLDEELLSADYAARSFDLPGALKALKVTLSSA